jgi:hypothetical protein
MVSRYGPGIYLAIMVTLAGGCSRAKPEDKLLGKWMSTPRVEEAVGQAVNAAADGKEVNPLARGAAQFFGQKLAEATMSVEVDFHSGGVVFFRGNTGVLSFPPDSDGTWEMSSSGPDRMDLRFGTETRQLEGKVLFRNNDEFTLKLKDAAALAPPSKTEDAQKQAPTSLVFKRAKD